MVVPFDTSALEVLRPPVESAQYLSIRYTERLGEAGAVASVGSRGDSYDNALAESTIGLYKTELVRNRGPFRGLDDLEIATLEWVDWFNHRRLHGELRMVPPAEFEQSFHLAEDAGALSGDLRPLAPAAGMTTPPDHGPRGPVEADRPALVEGAPAGLGPSNPMS